MKGETSTSSSRESQLEERVPLISLSESQTASEETAKNSAKVWKKWKKVFRERHVMKAISFVMDAIEETSRTKYLQDGSVPWTSHVIGGHIRRFVTPYLLLFWLLFTFWEKPVWCLSGDDDNCNNPDYPSWNVPYFSRWEALGIELGCWGTYTVDLSLRLTAYGWKYFDIDPALKVTGIMMVIAGADIIYGYSTSDDDSLYKFRLSPFLRVMLYIPYSQELRSEMMVVLKVLPKFSGVMVLGTAFVAIYAWAAVLIFDGTDEGSEYFSSYSETLWNLFVLLTTANWADIMMPAYTDKRGSCFFFIVYMLVGLFFLMNVVLAIAFQTYLDQEKADRSSTIEERRVNLKKAFQELDRGDKGYLTRSETMDLLSAFTSGDKAKLMFGLLDKNGNGSIHMKEFQNLCAVLVLEFEKLDTELFIFELFPKLKDNLRFKQLASTVKSDDFERAMDAMIVLCLFSVFLEVTVLSDTVGTAIDAILLSVFTIEIMVKIVVLDWDKFWSSNANRFDFVTTILVWVLVVYVLLPTDYNDTGIFKLAVFIRTLRCVRLLLGISSLKLIIDTLLSKWSRLFFSSFYIFGVLLVLNILIATILEKYITEYTGNVGATEVDGEVPRLELKESFV
eukprot:gene7928-9417_t